MSKDNKNDSKRLRVIEEEELELESPFSDKNIASMLKKAKRKNTLRTVIICAVVSPFVLFALYLGIVQLTYFKEDQMIRDVSMFSRITDPNVQPDRIPYLRKWGFLTGETHYHTYKAIEGRPVKWEDEAYGYNVLGGFSRIDRYTGTFFELEDEVENNKNGTRHLYSYETMQREMQFYRPDVTYPGYLNDFPLLEKYNNRAAEVAVSFDKPYTVAEIKSMLPPEARPVWYWVQTSEKEPTGPKGPSPQPDHAENVYGFMAKKGHIDGGNGTEKDFLLALESGLEVKGQYVDEYKRIYDYLRKEKTQPDVTDVKITGVVVTGTTEGLQTLKGKPFVKAAVLGAVTDY